MTDNIQKYLKKILLAATALFMVGSLATVIYYIIYPSAEYFHADCTDTILWAQASFDGKALFNPDFGYAAMLPFGGTMLMIPLIGIFGVTMTTHHIGMVLFTLLFFASAWFLCRSLKFSLPLSFSAVGILALVLSSSAKLREIFYEHVIYYSIAAAIIFVLLSLLIRFAEYTNENASSGKLIAVVFSTVIISALSALDGMQVVATAVLPVLVAAALEIFLEKDRKLLDKENRISIYFCIICGAATVVGNGILKLVSNGITAGYAGAFSQYANMNEWLGNLGNFPEHWFSLFGVDVYYGMGIFSAESIVNMVRMATAAVVAIVPVIALIFYNKFDRSSKMLILAHYGVSAVIMFGYIFGILSAANWRLSPMICTGLMVCFAAFKAAKPYVTAKRFSALMMCVLILMSAISVRTIVKMDKNGIENNEKYQLSKVLEENGLEYGFATFWNSQAITVLSDSKVMVANTDINENGIAPCYYQTNRSWFEEQEGIDRYFVLASDYEISVLEQTADWEMFNALTRDVIEIAGYKIFIFDSLLFLS